MILAAQSLVAAVPYEAWDVWLKPAKKCNFFPDCAGKEAVVTVLIFHYCMKTRHLFLTVCHKGKLHQFINTNSITGKYWIKFFIYVKSVTTSNVRTSFFPLLKMHSSSL